MSAIPLRDVLVEIRNQDYVLLSRKYTDENGLAVFSLPKGLYFVRASKKGYYDHEQQVTLTSDFLKEITLQKKAITEEYSGIDPTDVPDMPPEGWDYIYRFNNEIETKLIDSYGSTPYVLDLEKGILHLKPTETEYVFASLLQNMPLKKFATIMKIGDIVIEENAIPFFVIAVEDTNGRDYGTQIISHNTDPNKLIMSLFPDEVSYEIDKPNDWFIVFVDFINGVVKIYDKNFNTLFEQTFQQLTKNIQFGTVYFTSGYFEEGYAKASETLVDWIAFYTGGKKNATIFPSFSAYYLDKPVVSFIPDDFPYTTNDILFETSTENTSINLTDKTEVYAEAIEDGYGIINFLSSEYPNPQYVLLAFKPEILVAPLEIAGFVEILGSYRNELTFDIAVWYDPSSDSLFLGFRDVVNGYEDLKSIPYSEKYYVLACDFTGNGKIRLLDFNLNVLAEIVSEYEIPDYDKVEVSIFSRKTGGILEHRTYLDWLFFGSE